NRWRRRPQSGGMLAAVVMCITAAVPPWSMACLGQTRQQRAEVESHLSILDRVEALLIDAETGQRGYVITGKDEFLVPYRDATAQLPATFDDLVRSYALAGDEERRVVANITLNGRRKLDELAVTVDKRRTDGF